MPEDSFIQTDLTLYKQAQRFSLTSATLRSILGPDDSDFISPSVDIFEIVVLDPFVNAIPKELAALFNPAIGDHQEGDYE